MKLISGHERKTEHVSLSPYLLNWLITSKRDQPTFLRLLFFCLVRNIVITNYFQIAYNRVMMFIEDNVVYPDVHDASFWPSKCKKSEERSITLLEQAAL